jgi:hypothetical protein
MPSCSIMLRWSCAVDQAELVEDCEPVWADAEKRPTESRRVATSRRETTGVRRAGDMEMNPATEPGAKLAYCLTCSRE